MAARHPARRPRQERRRSARLSRRLRQERDLVLQHRRSRRLRDVRGRLRRAAIEVIEGGILMIRACLALACLAWLGCARPAQIREPVPVSTVSLRPFPTVHHGESRTGPDWCWSAPRSLRPLDYRSHYLLLLVERAMLSALMGHREDAWAFPWLSMDHGSTGKDGHF